MMGDFGKTMTFEETTKYLKISTKNLSAIKNPLDSLLVGGKNNNRPEVCICEQFAYLPNLVVYPNGSDMNELA